MPFLLSFRVRLEWGTTQTMTEERDYHVEEYSQHERDVLANMLMRSLRGSWQRPEERANMLWQLADEGLTDYDSGNVKGAVENFRNARHPDGRDFRYYYDEGPRLPEQTDEKTVRRLVGELPPGDMTFDRFGIEHRFRE